MKKLVMLFLAVVCTLSFSVMGCDDEGGLSCAEQCQADFVVCSTPARSRVTPSCTDILNSGWTVDCGLASE